MANSTGNGYFKKGHTLSKGNTGAKRRVVYDAQWKENLEKDGQRVYQRLLDHVFSDDKHISLRACDIFFKYARPPENVQNFFEASRDEKAMELVKKYNLTHEKLEQIQQAGIDAQQAKLQEFMMSEGLNEQMYYS